MRISSSTTDYTETLRILFQGKITSNYKFTNQPWHLMELLTNLMNTKNLVKYLQNNHYPNTWINLIKLLMVSCSWLRSAEQNQLAGWLFSKFQPATWSNSDLFSLIPSTTDSSWIILCIILMNEPSWPCLSPYSFPLNPKTWK